MRAPDPLGPEHPRWLLPVLLGVLALVGALGMAGLLGSEAEADCEAAGGRWVMGYGTASTCLFPEEAAR